MAIDKFVVGSIVESPSRQFTKVISFSKGRYAFSGWTSREHAEKSTVAQFYLNTYGVKNANLKVVSKGKGKDKENTTDLSGEDKITKAQLKKLSAIEVKTLAEELGIDNSGNRADVETRILAL